MSYFRSIAGRVVSCVLYLIAGVLSGGLMFLIMSMWRGGSPSVTTYISLFGSLLLVIAAVTTLFSLRGTGWIALAGVVAGWVFYWSPAYAPLNPARVLLLMMLLLVSSAYPIAQIVGTRKADT